VANTYYDNADVGARFQPGETARAGDVDDKFDQVEAGFDGAEVDTKRSLKLPTDAGTTEITETPAQRANKVVGFDASGNMVLTKGFIYRGDWVTSTLYYVNDVFRDAASTNNLYIVVEQHTSGTLATDISSGKVELAINVADVEAAKTAAQTAQTNAETAETNAETAELGAQTAESNAATSESNAATSESNAATSENNAASSESSTLSLKNATAALLDEFSDQYLGSKISDPTVDNDGNPLVDGAVYWNDTDEVLKFYTGTAWVAPEVVASTAASNAQSSESNASTSEGNAQTAESGAQTAQGLAETAQSNAETAQSNAETAESGSQTAQGLAETAQSNAETAESGAQTAQTGAETALDSFTDLYLGEKASEPATDNDGNALQGGAIYYNTTASSLYLYSGGAWRAAAFDTSGALLSANNLSDVASASTSRTNLDAQANLVSGTNIKTVNGTTLLGSGNLDALNGLATSLELQRYNETVAAGSATLDRADGGIQTFTMTANITLAVTIAAGESLTFHLSAGDTYAVTWPTMTWVGGSVPTLTAADVIEFWKVGSTLYGAYVGAV